jgi:hypothetical protein
VSTLRGRVYRLVARKNVLQLVMINGHALTCSRTCRGLAGAIDQIKEWQEGEMNADVKFTWRLTIPKGCRQATKIANVSAFADESEVPSHFLSVCTESGLHQDDRGPSVSREVVGAWLPLIHSVALPWIDRSPY